MTNKNIDLLRSFIAYCVGHPDERFWQALRNWAGVSFIFATPRDYDLFTDRLDNKARDTFHWEGKNK